jgi:hypothetical protein
MIDICCHDETWLGYGINVELGIDVIVGFANQTPGTCCDVVGICGLVVVATSVGVVASVGFAGHVDCIKGNAGGGCALALSIAGFCG